MKKITVIGGGTGVSTLLSSLKKYEDYDISAIVSMADNGGSNKVIRDEFGLLPISDVRQALVSLSNDINSNSRLLSKLFNYRFKKGVGIKGMTLGNLFIVAMTNIFGSQLKAIEKTGDILKSKGKVIPVTNSDSNLVAIYDNGMKIIGEHFIDEPRHDGKIKIKKIYLSPPSIANKEAVCAIKNADLVIIGPGDLYTSLMVNLVVKGIAKAVKNTKAKIAYIMNIMTSFGETFGFKASDHIKVVENYILKRQLDFVFINISSLPKKALKLYEKENNFPVKDDIKKDCKRMIIRGDFLNRKIAKKSKSDILKRSIIKHDSDKIAKSINFVINKYC